jgi:integrase-like protein/Arm domain-containing DNA-binding protein
VAKLSDREFKAEKAKAAAAQKTLKLFDGGGLYLLTKPMGAQGWRLKYRYGGKERLMSFGTYPEVTVKEARQRRDDTRAAIRDGRDPAADRREQKTAAKRDAAETFSEVAKEWLKQQKAVMSDVTYQKAEWTFRLLKPLDATPVAKLRSPEVLAVLRRIESSGTIESAHRAKMRISQVMRYAVATGRAENDPTYALRGALKPRVVTNRAAITDPTEIGNLLRAIDAYHGQPTTKAALQLAPMLFARPGNLRAMEWVELTINADEPVWRIPAVKMKKRGKHKSEDHIVPLSSQAVEILLTVKPYSGAGRFVFPSLRSIKRCLSENTLTVALRSLGFDGDAMTVHGFRAMASTRLHELNFAPDLIERQLAHVEPNKVRAAYNRAAHLAERRSMMQAWADYLDGLKAVNGCNRSP